MEFKTINRPSLANIQVSHVPPFILHHVNTRPQTAKVTLQYLAAKKSMVLPLPPYSPVLAPRDFWLLPKFQEQLRNQTFSTNEDIHLACNQSFTRILPTEFDKTFQKWIKQWERYTEIDSRYFEKEVI